MKNVNKGTQYHAHPNYHNSGTWQDWAMVSFGTNSAGMPKKVPSRLLLFYKHQSTDDQGNVSDEIECLCMWVWVWMCSHAHANDTHRRFGNDIKQILPGMEDTLVCRARLTDHRRCIAKEAQSSNGMCGWWWWTTSASVSDGAPCANLIWSRVMHYAGLKTPQGGMESSTLG